MVEVTNLQTNGVQFWISVTNTPGTTNGILDGEDNLYTNGCLYANLVDMSNVSHEICSAPGLIQSNIYQHVALTYDTNSGMAMLYYNGTNVATTNLGVFYPKTGGDVLLGKDMSLATNNYYGGEMDEMSIYGRALSAAEIAAIYHVSAITPTNGHTGKFDPVGHTGLRSGRGAGCLWHHHQRHLWREQPMGVEQLHLHGHDQRDARCKSPGWNRAFCWMTLRFPRRR